MKYTLPLFFLFLFAQAKGATSITTPSVAGHWTLAGSPYLIYNDVTVWNSDTLTIDPGVEVVFQGHYFFDIFGVVKAKGTATMRVSFHAADTAGWGDTATTYGGWKGMRFEISSYVDTFTRFEYCDIYDIKRGGFFAYDRTLRLKHVNFYHNMNMSSQFAKGPIVLQGYAAMENCTIHDNWGARAVLYIGRAGKDTVGIRGCKIYDNNVGFEGPAGNTVWIEQMKGTIDSNDIYGNFAGDTGTALNIRASYLIVKKNKIHGNTGPRLAALTASVSKLDISRNLICNNLLSMPGSCGAGDGGAGIHVSGSDTGSFYKIRNNIIANNESSFQGSAICLISALAVVANNHIVNNKGTSVFVGSGGSILKNNIFYGNGPGEANVEVSAGDTITFTHNWTQFPYYRAITGAFTYAGDSTTNVTGANPGIVTPTADNNVTTSALTANFGLVSSSACINKGDTAGAFADSTDYAGAKRIHGTIDIGVFENQAISAVAGIVAEDEFSVYPNPATNTLFVNTSDAMASLELYDAGGRLVMQKKVASHFTTMDVTALSAGIYILIRVENSGARIPARIVKN